MARNKISEPGDWNLTPETEIEAHRTGLLDDPRYAIDTDSSHKGKLHFPLESVPAGWTYIWANERLMNEDQPQNLQALYRKGYDFVPASDHPEFVVPMMNHRFSDGKNDGNIHIEGCVLMKIPTEVYGARQRAAEAESAKIMKESSSLTDYLGEAPGRFKVENDQGYSPIHVRSRG